MAASDVRDGEGCASLRWPHASRSDEALLETSVAAADISKKLPEILTPMTSSLFERFGVTGPLHR